MVLSSVPIFVLNPLLFPETLSPSMPTSENEISFRFFVSVFFTFDLGARPTSENEISFRFLCPFFFAPLAPVPGQTCMAILYCMQSLYCRATAAHSRSSRYMSVLSVRNSPCRRPRGDTVDIYCIPARPATGAVPNG